MSRGRWRGRAARLLVAIGLMAGAFGGCGGRGNYGATFTLAGEELVCEGEPSPAVVLCGRAGVDAVQVESIDPGGLARDVSVFSCALCEPAVGPSLQAGRYILRATPLDRDLVPFGEGGSLSVEVPVEIRAGQVTPVSFDLLLPPQCSNRIDDDLDGLVDLDDPGCNDDPDGEREAGPPTDGGPQDGGDGGPGDGGDGGDGGPADGGDGGPGDAGDGGDAGDAGPDLPDGPPADATPDAPPADGGPDGADGPDGPDGPGGAGPG